MCPYQKDLPQWLEGAIPEAQAAVIEAHLDHCLACTATIEKLVYLTPGEPASLPSQIGPYRLKKQLGSGSFGRVFLADHETLQCERAIKVLHPNYAADPRFQMRFEREARSAAKVEHDHIVRVHHFGVFPSNSPGSEQPQFVLEMEYVAGESLEDRLQREEHISPREAARIVCEVARGLAAAHARAIIHSDLKPSNILLEHGSRRAKITDFGVARILEEQLHEASPYGSTRAGGTPEYMSPEQYRDRGTVDVRSDIHSLGVVLYQLLTRQLPFGTRKLDGEATVRDRVLTADRTFPAQAQVPADLRAICLKCLHKDPAERYVTATALADDLQCFLHGLPTQARPLNPVARCWHWCRRNPGRSSAVAFTIAAVAIAIVIGVQYRIQQERERDHHRESLILGIQGDRLITHTTAGWFEKVWSRVREAAEIRKGGDLRNQAAATLIGIDARPFKSFDKFGASSVAFDAAGKRLLMGGMTWPNKRSEPARLWDRDTDQLIVSRHGGKGPVAFGADGTPLQLVVPREGTSLLLWDVAKQQTVQDLKFPAPDKPEPGSAPTVHALQLAADGSWVAASVALGAGKETLVVWDSVSGKLLHQWAVKSRALAFAPDASLLASGDQEGQITVWSLPKGQPVTSLKSGRAEIQSLAFGRDVRRRAAPPRAASGWLLAAGENGGTVTIWDLETNVPRTYCHGSHYHVYAMVFSPDGSTLASSGRQETKLWDIATGRLLFNLRASDFLTGLAFTADGRKLAVAGQGLGTATPSVTIWELEYGRGLQTLRGLVGQVEKVSFSPDGRMLAGLAQGSQVGIWDLSSGRLRHVFDAPKALWTDNASLAFSPDSHQFAYAGSGFSGGEAKLWDLTTGQELRSWKLPPGLQDHLGFHPSGKLLLFRIETQDGKQFPGAAADPREHPRICRIRDLLSAERSKPLAEIVDFTGGTVGARAPADASYFVVEGFHGDPRQWTRSIKAFDGLTGKEIWSLPSTLRSSAGSLHNIDPTGRFLVVVPRHYDDGPERGTLVEMPSGKLLGTLEDFASCLGPAVKYWGRTNHRGRPGLALFHRDDQAPLVRLGIDVQTTSENHTQFNATGSHVAWGNVDGTVSVCDIEEVRRRLAQLGLGW